MNYRSTVPVIATANVRASIDYYVSVLGFREHFTFGDPLEYAGVERDGVQFYITLDEKFASTIHASMLHPEVFLWVTDVDAVFADHKARGAKIAEPIANRPWDARQYVIEDPNGYFIKVAEAIDEIA